MAGRAYGLLDPSAGLEVYDSILAHASTSAAARLEKPRLCRRLEDLEGGRRHYFAALAFDPAPGNDALREEAEKGSPKLNSVAMQTKDGAEGFSSIARRSGGSHTIVGKDGEPIDGFEFMKDPEKFAGRL